MNNFAAHYIWQGKKQLLAKESVLIWSDKSWSIFPLKGEMAQTIFYNGIIIPVSLTEKSFFLTLFNTFVAKLKKTEIKELSLISFLEKSCPEVDFTKKQVFFLLNCNLHKSLLTHTSTLDLLYEESAL